MDGSITLTPSQRNRLLSIYRKEEVGPQVRQRAHIILLLADGQPWSLIQEMLYCSSSTLARWKRRFEKGGIEALLKEERGRPAMASSWMKRVLGWVRNKTPRDFGYCRSRWCCSALVVVLWTFCGVKVSRETLRRRLCEGGMVWRRPRPALGKEDEHKAYKLRKIRELLRDLGEDEAAVFQDEVDLNLNPEIGSMWMPKGEQAQVMTPGTNVKRYLSGAMSWRSGELIVAEGNKRNAELFIANLEAVRRSHRHWRRIHVICDNARFHTAKGSKAVRKYLLEHQDRIVLHYLPAYSPQHNPIERVWWHLREEITRNHRCQSIEELAKLTLAWLDERGAFKIEGRMYERLKAAA
jgi:putative transposase